MIEGANNSVYLLSSSPIHCYFQRNRFSLSTEIDSIVMKVQLRPSETLKRLINCQFSAKLSVCYINCLFKLLLRHQRKLQQITIVICLKLFADIMIWGDIRLSSILRILHHIPIDIIIITDSQFFNFSTTKHLDGLSICVGFSQCVWSSLWAQRKCEKSVSEMPSKKMSILFDGKPNRILGSLSIRT